jgi:hypothetical protein
MDPRLVLLMRAYAFRLQRGRTPEQAEEYIRRRFPGFSELDYIDAIYYATIGLQNAANLNEAPRSWAIELALFGLAEGQTTIALRVVAEVTVRKQDGTIETQHITVWPDAPVTATGNDVDVIVRRLARETIGDSAEVLDVTWEYVGPQILSGGRI